MKREVAISRLEELHKALAELKKLQEQLSKSHEREFEITRAAEDRALSKITVSVSEKERELIKQKEFWAKREKKAEEMLSKFWKIGIIAALVNLIAVVGTTCLVNPSAVAYVVMAAVVQSIFVVFYFNSKSVAGYVVKGFLVADVVMAIGGFNLIAVITTIMVLVAAPILRKYVKSRIEHYGHQWYLAYGELKIAEEESKKEYEQKCNNARELAAQSVARDVQQYIDEQMKLWDKIDKLQAQVDENSILGDEEKEESVVEFLISRLKRGYAKDLRDALLQYEEERYRRGTAALAQSEANLRALEEKWRREEQYERDMAEAARRSKMEKEAERARSDRERAKKDLDYYLRYGERI